MFFHTCGVNQFCIIVFFVFANKLFIYIYIYTVYTEQTTEVSGAETDTEEKKSLNKVIIFVFFVHKKYYRNFITLRLNHCRCHMDYFNDDLTTFLGLERVSSIAVYAGLESSWISSKIS